MRSVSISVNVKTVPRSLLTYPVPISARRNDRKSATIGMSDQRAGCAITIGWDAVHGRQSSRLCSAPIAMLAPRYSLGQPWTVYVN
jgi:hypothetical protein